jgi:hypothetical protein
MLTQNLEEPFQALSDTKMNQAKVYGTGTSLKAFGSSGFGVLIFVMN